MTESAEHPQPEPDAPGGATAGGPPEATERGVAPAPDSVTAAVAPPVPAPAAAPVTDYTDAGVPTLDYLQDKLDRRYGTAVGATELAAAGDEAKAAQQAAADRAETARERLEEIRRSLHPDGE